MCATGLEDMYKKLQAKKGTPEEYVTGINVAELLMDLRWVRWAHDLVWSNCLGVKHIEDSAALKYF